MSEYVFHCLLWSGFGFILGFATARLIKQEKLDMRAELRSLRRPTMRQALAVVIVLMSLVSVIAVGFQSAALRDSARCNADYAANVVEAFRARDRVAERGRNAANEKSLAEDQLWLGFIANAPKPGQQRTKEQQDNSLTSLNTYLEKNSAYREALSNSSAAQLVFPLPPNRCPQPTDWSN